MPNGSPGSEYQNSIVIAQNQESASRQDRVEPGAEIAFLPPVSGGSSPYLHEISDDEGISSRSPASR
jgi:hypothetical protein